MAGGGLDPVVEEEVFIATILGVLLIQWLLHLLKHSTQRNHQLAELVAMMYQELTVLGVVAFLLWVSEVAGVLHISIDDKHTFERIHNTLFICGCVYGCMVTALAVMSRSISGEWRRYDDMDFDVWQAKKAELQRVQGGLGLSAGDSIGTWQVCHNLSGFARWYALLHPVKFHDLKYHLIRSEMLEVKFRFSVYLELCKKQVLLEMVEVSSSSWSWFGLWLAVDLWVRGVVTEYNHSFDTTAHMVVINCAIIIVGMFVYTRVRRAYARVLTQDIVSFDAEVAEHCNLEGMCRPRRRQSIANAAEVHLQASSDIASSFWLRRRDVIPRLFQLLVFSWCLNFSLMLTYSKELAEFGAGFAAALGTSGVAAVLLLWYIRRSLGLFIVTQHVGDRVDRALLSKAIALDNKRRAKKKVHRPASERVAKMTRRVKQRLCPAMGCSDRGTLQGGLQWKRGIARFAVFMTIACFAGAGVATHHLSEPVADEVHVVMVVLASLLAVEQVVTVIMFGWSWANCSRIGVYNVLDLLLTAMFLGLSIVGPWEEGWSPGVIRALIVARTARYMHEYVAAKPSHSSLSDTLIGGIPVSRRRQLDLSQRHMSSADLAQATSARSLHAKADGGESLHTPARIMTLNAGVFNDLVLNHPSAWLIKVYAPWCQSCKAFQPEWHQVPGLLCDDRLALGELDGDAEAELATKLGIMGFPTIILLPTGPKSFENVVAFSGKRTATNVAEFALEHLTSAMPPVRHTHEAHPLVGRPVPTSMDVVYIEAGELSKPRIVSVGELFSGRRVVLFGLPGAFTMVCSTMHLPGFVQLAADIRAQGVDDIICLSVNDAQVMAAWKRQQGITTEVSFIADWDARFVKALGLELDLTADYMGVRSQRFSAVARYGVFEHVNVEPPDSAGALSTSGAYTVFRQLATAGDGHGGVHHDVQAKLHAEQLAGHGDDARGVHDAGRSGGISHDGTAEPSSPDNSAAVSGVIAADTAGEHDGDGSGEQCNRALCGVARHQVGDSADRIVIPDGVHNSHE